MSEARPQRVVVEQHGSIALLALGEPDEKIAVLTTERMTALDRALDQLLDDSTLTALIITGASASGFCAGADIDAIRDVTDVSQGEALAKEGQRIFAKLESFKIPTVAVVRGACVGGGCELVLACKHRLLTDAPETKIGLPEVKLGILPGFGGTQRLPRLVGLPNALNLILKGRVVTAREAKSLGLADGIIVESLEGTPAEKFEAAKLAAVSMIEKKALPQKRALTLGERFFTFSAIGRSVVRKKALASVLRETKGHYPAPPKALHSAVNGLARPSEGYAFEARALGELIATPESKALIHVFRLSEGAGKLGRPAAGEVTGAKVAVIGAGVMGSGIAAAFLTKGFSVSLVDTFPAALDKGRALVEQAVEKRKGASADDKKRMITQLSTSGNLESVQGSALVIEAVIEDTEMKRKVFQTILPGLPPEGILASNTSSLSLSELFQGFDRPERFAGLHFFNPADKMPLLEIVRTPKTSEKTILRSAAFAGLLGKSPIVVEDVPGFLVNRILTPYLSEAAHLLSQGVGVKEIDRAALHFGMPMGPLRLLDEIGLDVAAKVASVITAGYGERMAGPDYASKLAASGLLGKKNGKGFYRYAGKEETLNFEASSSLGLPPVREPHALAEDVVDRLLLPMVNEAVRCLDEGVAGSPGPGAAGQIDLGSVMGLGFAPFRGGVIYYAETRGAEELQDRLTQLASRYGKRFTPADGITARAKSGKTFYESL